MSIDIRPQLCSTSAKIGPGEHYTELDSHADMCVLGRNAKITHTHDQEVLVSGYDKTMGERRYKVVSGELSYDDLHSGQPVVLEIHQAIHIPTISHNLLLPMQLMTNNVLLDSKPKFLHTNPTNESHSLTAPFIGAGHGPNPLTIHFSLSGIVSYFPTWTPTETKHIESP